MSINKKEKVWTRGGLALIAKAEREGEGRREREIRKKKKGQKEICREQREFSIQPAVTVANVPCLLGSNGFQL